MAEQKKDPRDLIVEYLKDRGIKQTWLRDKLNLSDSHLSLVLSKNRDLTDENLKKINEILGTNF